MARIVTGEFFSYSNLGKRLENGQMCIPPQKSLPGTDVLMPFVMVGDEAFL
jgi:hypothetical protein